MAEPSSGRRPRRVVDTLARLAYSLKPMDDGKRLPPPGWALKMDENTLVLVGRGGSVRLIGDDRQLAAVGAGGVLRDVQEVAGAAILTELMRFTDASEAAATLALRDGDAAAAAAASISTGAGSTTPVTRSRSSSTRGPTTSTRAGPR